MTVASQRWFFTAALLALEAAYASISLSVGAIIADSMDQVRVNYMVGHRPPLSFAKYRWHEPCPIIHLLS